MTPKSKYGQTRAAFVTGRNRVIAARYYYWSEVRRVRFDDVLKILSVSEFFICQAWVENAIRVNNDYINELNARKATVSELRNEYPGWNWEEGKAFTRQLKLNL